MTKGLPAFALEDLDQILDLEFGTSDDPVTIAGNPISGIWIEMTDEASDGYDGLNLLDVVKFVTSISNGIFEQDTFVTYKDVSYVITSHELMENGEICYYLAYAS